MSKQIAPRLTREQLQALQAAQQREMLQQMTPIEDAPPSPSPAREDEERAHEIAYAWLDDQSSIVRLINMIAGALSAARAEGRLLGRREAWGARHAGSWDMAQKFMPKLTAPPQGRDQ